MVPDSAPSSAAAIQHLIAVVAQLRDPERGCPWDLEQTHRSLLPYVLEEAHEVADAIRHGDDRDLCEELGDLLLQVVLHARIAAEQQRFSLEDVARAISDKLIRRHPHVFPAEAGAARQAGAENGELVTGETMTVEKVRQNWEAIKASERAERQKRAMVAAGSSSSSSGSSPEAAAAVSASPLSDQLAGKVRAQPALAAAMTISRKAAAAGFEWDDLDGVWQKVQEELEELREAIASGDRDHAQEELGDVLFTLVNVARWSGLDPEEGLVGTNHRFLDRFSRVEAALGGTLQGRGIRELESHWQTAKAQIRSEALQRSQREKRNGDSQEPCPAATPDSSPSA